MKKRVLERPQLEVTNFHGVVTVAPQMRQLFSLLERVARSDATVLLRGETGTGKELMARALHSLSAREAAPFLAVNCATLNAELLASELFGHVRGAFTGAIAERPGLFSLADGGTVFLDEVAELPLDIQARLLRVLQERTFTPVGGTAPVHVDVRLISATNKGLRKLVAEGHFREDLMYRVRVVPLFLPRLSEREGDVEALLWHFIERFNAAGLRQVTGIDRDAMDALLEYCWPGNVRELSNVVEHAFAIGIGPVLGLADLTPELRGEEPPGGGVSSPGTPGEREQIVEALEATGGRKGKAAERLGMSRSTLWRKLREHRIS